MSTNPNTPQAAENPVLQAQLAAEYPAQTDTPKPDSSALQNMAPDAALEQLNSNPVGFIRQIVDTAAMEHLQRLKEEAELQGSLNAFRKAHPDAGRFEPFILQEVARLLQNDSANAGLPWDQLLEKGLAVFREKFKATLKDNPGMVSSGGGSADASGGQMEGGSNRQLPKASPAFTRNQIAGMSLPEFIAQEQAINDALQNNRIR